MPFTNYADQQIVQALLTGTALGAPATWYLALSTTAPTQAKGSAAPFWNFTEPTAGTGGYARLSVAANTTEWGPLGSEPSAGYTDQNIVSLAWPASGSGGWSTGSTPLVAVGFFDAASAGNLWIYATLTPSVQVNATGVVVSFPADSLTVTDN